MLAGSTVGGSATPRGPHYISWAAAHGGLRDVHQASGRTAGCGWRPRLMRTMACLALIWLAGCASLTKKAPQASLEPWPEIRSDVRMENLRARMYEYSITFAAEVDLAGTAIERRTADATVRRNAVLWKVRAVPEMRKACFRLEPIAALIDAWTFARQMDQFWSGGAGADAFGTFQPEAVEVSRRLVDQVRTIGNSIAVSPEAAADFERRVIDSWLTAHPLRDTSFARESPMARFADQSRASGDTLQSVGTMEDLAIGVTQQARIYLADLPRQIRGELDLMRYDILTAEDVRAPGRPARERRGSNRIASTAETISPLVLNERRIVLDELNRQRALVMGAVSLEREQAIAAIVRAFAVERGELIRNIEAERLATLEWGTAERREAIAEVRRELAGSIDALRGERALVEDHLRHAIDLIFLRVALFLVAAVVLAPLVAHAYARVWPRRWREPTHRAPRPSARSRSCTPHAPMGPSDLPGASCCPCGT